MKEKVAIDLFQSGLNCAQTVVATFVEDLQIDLEFAKSISCAFGAGMGRLQETCGAVTGAYMVIGMHNSKKHSDNAERKSSSYSMVQEFSKKFITLRGSTNCKKLINCDLNTEEGMNHAKENGLFETVCEKCITDSIAILEELMN